MLLLAAVEPWASSHMFHWWTCTLIDASATLCLLVGTFAVMSRRKLFIFSTLCGAIAVASLGFTSVATQGDHLGASLLFAFTFFALTVSAPLFVAALSSFELWRLRKQNEGHNSEIGIPGE